MKKHSLFFCILMLFSTLGLFAQEWETGGSLRNFAITGKTLFDEDYYYLIHRLRNLVIFRPDDASELRLELDNQLSWGSYLDSSQYRLQKSLHQDNYFDLESFPIEEESMEWRTRVHRLSYRLSKEKYDFSVGRQRIAWGTARIWNPMDLFNQISPTAIEAGEIAGADSLYLAVRPSDGFQVEVAGAIGVDEDDTRWGIKARKSISSYDFSLMAGQVREQDVLGFDFTGYLGDAGFRGEFVRFSDELRDYLQAVVSYEYIFPNSVSILVEYLYNGGSLGNLPLMSLAGLDSNTAIVTRNKHFLGVRSAGQVTQLISAGVISVYDLEDGSIFLYPNLVYNWKQNIDVMAGFQLFLGDNGEYSSYENAGVFMLTWYF